MPSVEELAAATVFVDGRWSSGNGHEYASVDPSTAQPFARWHLADVAQADAGVAAARRGVRRLEPHRTGGAGSGAAPVRRPAGEAPRGAGPARHHRGRLADLARSHPADRDTGREPEVGGRRRRIRTARWLPRAAARPGWSAAGRERAAAGAHRGGRRGDAVQLPGQHDRLEGRPRARGRLHRRPAAVPAWSARARSPSSGWPKRPASRRVCSTWCRAARTSVQRLSAHPDVDLVSFTGSNAIGAAVAEAAAPLHTKVVLELGGKSPTVVLPGADLARAVGPSMLRFCRNAGQGCGATTRILVHRSQYDEFVDEAVAFLRERVPVGDPAQRGDRGRSADQRRAPRPRGGLPA